MTSSTIESQRRWIIHVRNSMIGVVVIAILLGPVRLIATHPREVSDALLRLGGRIIGGSADKPGLIVGVSIILLVTVWLGVILRWAWEARPRSE